MTTFTLHLFGQWRLTCQNPSPLKDEQPKEIPLSLRKEQALLSYVSVQSHLVHNREALMTMLWPDSSPKTVRNNLRVALHRIHKALEQPARPSQPLLHVTRQQIAFNRQNHRCDAQRFQELSQAIKSHGHANGYLCPACVPLATELVNLYNGEFLQGFSLDSAPEFTEWLTMVRENFRLQTLEMLYLLSQHHIAHGDFAQAQRYAQQQIEIEPLTERAYQQLIHIHAALGEQSQAAYVLECCRLILQDRLNISLSWETQRLYDSFFGGGQMLGRTQASGKRHFQSGTNSRESRGSGGQVQHDNRRDRNLHRHPLPPRPALPAGREAEQTLLTERIRTADYRLFTLAGAAGVGKSRLALAVAHQLTDDFIDGALYVNLAGCQNSREIQQAILDALGVQPVREAVEIDRLWSQLASQHLLLVLDAFEQVRDGVDLVIQLLKKTPNVVLLVTAQSALRLQAEDLFVLTVDDTETPAEPEPTAETQNPSRDETTADERQASYFEDSDVKSSHVKFSHVEASQVQPEQFKTEIYMLSGLLQSLGREDGDAEQTFDQVDQRLSDNPNRTQNGRIKLYKGLGKLAQLELLSARPLLQEALSIGGQIRNPDLQARALNGLGGVEAQLGNSLVAKEYHRKSLLLFQELGDVLQACHALHGISWVSYALEDWAEASRSAEEALDLALRNGLNDSQLIAQIHLGHALIQRNQPERATAMLERNRLRNDGRSASALEASAGAAWAYHVQGNLDRAYSLAHPVVERLDGDLLTAFVDPHRLLWHLYQILIVAQDDRAERVLGMGWRQIQSVARNIEPSAVRQHYLTGTSFRRNILQEQRERRI